MLSQNPTGDWMTVIEDPQGKYFYWELVLWQVWDLDHNGLNSISHTCKVLPSCEIFMKIGILIQGVWVVSEVSCSSSQSSIYVSMSGPWDTLWASLASGQDTIGKYDTYGLERWLQGAVLKYDIKKSEGGIRTLSSWLHLSMYFV